MAIGAEGVISGTANLIPHVMVSLFRACLEKNWDEGQKIHLTLSPLFKALSIEGNPVPLKAALNLCGLPAGNPRLPLLPLHGHFLPLIKQVIEPLAAHGHIPHFTTRR